jgi:hypothetical protein
MKTKPNSIQTKEGTFEISGFEEAVNVKASLGKGGLKMESGQPLHYSFRCQKQFKRGTTGKLLADGKAVDEVKLQPMGPGFYLAFPAKR